eukprot:g2349.t1
MALQEAEQSEKPITSYRIASLVKREEATGSFYESFFGNIDAAYFFTPLSGYSANRRGAHHMRFRRNFDFVPYFFTIILGFQQASTALTCIVGPALYLAASFQGSFYYYTIQSSVIIAGICTIVNCLEIKFLRLPFQIGTGLISVLINSVVFLPIYRSRMTALVQEDEVSPHDAFGKMLGTTAVCSLAYIALAFVPRRVVRHIIPPYVSAIILIHVGLYMLVKAVQFWGGGILCATMPYYMPLCNNSGDVHLPFGSAEYLGKQHANDLTCELFGTAFIRHNIVLVSVIFVGVISMLIQNDGHSYFNGDQTDNSPDFGFLWTTVYKLGFDKKAVLPLLGAFLVTYLEATAVMEGTLEESRAKLGTAESDRRIQGGLIVGSIMSFLAPLMTGIPVVPSSSNITVIAASRQASNSIGIAAGVWLVIFGILGKFIGIFLDMCDPIKGGIGVILECGVIWTGLKILLREKWDRRRTFITILAFSFGLAGIVEPQFYNDNLWTPDGDMHGFVESLRLTVITMLRVPYLVSGVVAIILHLTLPTTMEIVEDDDALLDTYEPIDDD